MFHAVIYLNLTLISLTAQHHKKNTASNVLLQSTNIANKVYDVQIMQTKFARLSQKSFGY